MARNYLSESAMAMDLNKPNRSLDLINPRFLAIVNEGLSRAFDDGLRCYVFEGWRSGERQNYLFDQGRGRSGKIVTNARAGESCHQFGIAVDIVFDGSEKPGIQWSWDGDYIGSKLDDYHRLGEIMESVGLRRLRNRQGGLIELPHFQLDIGYDTRVIAQFVKYHGVLALWDRINVMLESGSPSFS